MPGGAPHIQPAESDALKGHKLQNPSKMPTAVGLWSVQVALGFLCPASWFPREILAEIYWVHGQVDTLFISSFPPAFPPWDAWVPQWKSEVYVLIKLNEQPDAIYAQLHFTQLSSVGS